MTQDRIKNDIKIGPVRMSYANVFEPRENLNGKMQYDCVCLLPKEPNSFNADPKKGGKELTNLIKLIAEESKLKGEWKNPIKDGDKETDSDGNPKHPGYWFFSAKTGEKFPPVVVNAQNVPIGENSGFVSGDWARVALRVKAYEAPTGKGVTFYLEGVRWVAKDEPFGSDPDSMFADESQPAPATGGFDPFADD